MLPEFPGAFSFRHGKIRDGHGKRPVTGTVSNLAVGRSGLFPFWPAAAI
jgi:hypothetical protein